MGSRPRGGGPGVLLALTLATLLLAPPAHADGGLVSPKIVNGLPTQTQPATGALLVPFGSGHQSGCTGTLIGCQTFLTAAHCVCPGDTFCTPTPSSYAVYLQHSGIHAVSAIDVHPDYFFSVDADVAVVTLTAPLTGIPPVPLNTTATPSFGTSGTIAGFGVTDGNLDDGGVLREGQVVTGTCSGLVPEPEHVCWTFQAPVGPPGQDSNTCSGDSGGPLFIDPGSGPVVAGITSGGTSGNCLGTDRSFDANVFEFLPFIQGIGGADLSNTTCGTHSQVGDLSTTVDAWSQGGLPDSAERTCRKEVQTQIRRYSKKRHNLVRRCLDAVQKGAKSGPCPDALTATKLQKAVAKVDPARLDLKCPSGVIAGSGLGAACASAQDGAELAACVVATGDLEVDTLIDLAYVDPLGAGPIADPGQASCQRSIGSELSRYGHVRVARLASCQRKADLGSVAACPDAATAAKISIFSSKAQARLGNKCSDAQVAALDASAGFGGACAGVTTVNGLAACGLVAHDVGGDALLALVPGAQVGGNVQSFAVPVGADRFRVTLNAVDASSHDLDLYVKLGSAPTPADFDLSSTGSGVFEWVEQAAPTAGTWYVRVEEVAGSQVEFQLTATVFQP